MRDLAVVERDEIESVLEMARQERERRAQLLEQSKHLTQQFQEVADAARRNTDRAMANLNAIPTN